MADLAVGAQIPEVRVTPDKYLTVRYAGASGDFNPIHIDEEFARAVGLPGRILHGLWTMAQVARAQTEAAGGPEHLKRLSVQFRGMGVPEQEVIVSGTVREASDGRVVIDTVAEQGGQADHPQRRGRARALRLQACLGVSRAPTIKPMLTPRQEQILCKVVDDYLQTGQPVASRSIAADPELDCAPSTVRNELALLEEHGLLAHPHVSAGRVPTDAGHRYVVDRMLISGRGLEPERRLELSLIRQEVEEAMRATTETLSQMTNLLAVVSAPSAAQRHDPARRGARAAAAGGDGGDHHLHRRRLQAARHVRGPGRSRARGVGGGVSERAARRLGAGRAHAPPAPGRPEPVRARAGFPRAPCPGLRRRSDRRRAMRST